MAKSRDAIASDFFVNTCRPGAGPNVQKIITWFFTEREHDFVKVPTGSRSELYIESLLSCIGDLDVMTYNNDELAVLSRHDIPHNLPHVFKDNVMVMEIVNSQFSNYAYLRVLGDLIRLKHEEGYEFLPRELKNSLYSKHEAIEQSGDTYASGPASTLNEMDIVRDLVPCVRCLSWPTQANEWPTRRRKSDWPDAATIGRIVRNGCDLVNVTHHQARDNEFAIEFQWRLSFSRAETALLNSWTLTQQVIYHILRVVNKGAGLCKLRDNNEDQILSGYHMKTLMMWTCERKHTSWWISSNVIQVSKYIIDLLLRCCMSYTNKGYFIADSNLLECNVTPELISQLRLFTDLTYLTEWIVNNYIPRCVQICPDIIQMLLPSITSDQNLEIVTNAVVQWKKSREENGKLSNMMSAVYNVQLRNYTSNNVLLLFREIKAIDRRLCYPFLSTVFMKCSASLYGSNFPDNIMNILAVIFLNSDKFIKTPSSHTALNLLRLAATTSDNTTKSILLILSQFYLSQRSRDKESVSCVYLAVLYYIIGQYQTAKDYCIRAASNVSSPCVVEGRCLPKIDDSIDNVLGLVVLYKFKQTHMLLQNHKQNHGVTASFNAESFGNYLAMKCSLIGCHRQTHSKPGKLQPLVVAGIRPVHKRYVSRTKKSTKPVQATCISDHLFAYFMSINAVKPAEPLSLKFTPSELHRLLLFHAVEQMTLFHQIMSRDYQSLCTVVTTDIQAMYAYHCGQYRRCLQLSLENFIRLCGENSFFQITLHGPITLLVNNDLSSFLATIAITDQFNHPAINQLTLSLYLTIKSKVKLQHSVRSLLPDLGAIRQLRSQHPAFCIVDRLLLAFIYRRTILHVRQRLCMHTPRYVTVTY